MKAIFFLLFTILASSSLLFLNQTPSTSHSVHAASSYPNFKGIIEFSGGNTGTDATNSSLVGTNLIFYWSQLEPQKGQYQWDVLDNAMKPWTATGKKVVIRITTAGWAKWSPPYSKQGTPQWVFDEGVKHVTELDGAIYPEYWNPIFLQELQTFIQAYGARYDGSPDVLYIQVGLGVGGEGKVDSYNSNTNMLQLWQSIGYTDQLWWDTVQKIMTMYKSAFTKTPLAVMPDKIFIGGTSGYSADMFNSYAAQNGFWLQNNGLVAGQTLKSVWQTVPHPAEQRNGTSSSGDTMKGDIQLALDQGANYLLVFQSDIQNSANQTDLAWGASLANTSPTVTGTTTITSSAGGTPFSIDVCPHGIGNCGDNANPGNGGNASPKHTTRQAMVMLYDSQNNQVGSGQGTITYNTSTQRYTGIVSIPNVTSGSYLVSVQVNGFLSYRFPGIITVTGGQQVTLPAVSLVTGDVNNDNVLSILDYNLLIGCYGSKMTTSSCSAAPTSDAANADLNDDGAVESTDYNLFIREVSVQKGQ